MGSQEGPRTRHSTMEYNIDLASCQFINVICETLTFNCTLMRLAAGLRPDPLVTLQRSPKPPSWMLGVRVGAGKGGEGKRGGERRGDERKGGEKGNEGGGTGPDHPSKKLVTGMAQHGQIAPHPPSPYPPPDSARRRALDRPRIRQTMLRQMMVGDVVLVN